MAENEIVITRLVNAPRARVWQMFTQAKHITHWWGPNGFTNTIFDMDVRVGGIWRFVMHGPDGTNYNNWIRYTEVVAPVRMRYAHGGDDEAHADFNAATELKDVGDKTEVTLRLILNDAAHRARLVEFGAVQGGEQTLARLDAYVSDTPEAQCFVCSRTFKASRDQVWRAWSEPQHFAKWWGPTGCTIALKKMQFVTGGEVHYSMNWAGAPAMWGKFVYAAIEPQSAIQFINSFSDEAGEISRAPFFDDWPHEVVNTVSFVEKDGNTTVTLRAGPINATAGERARFASIFESMTQGYGGTFEQLANFLSQ